MLRMIPVEKLIMTDVASIDRSRREVIRVMKIILNRHGQISPLTVCQKSKHSDIFEVITGRAVLAAWMELEMGSSISCDVVVPKDIPCKQIVVFSDIDDSSRLGDMTALLASVRENGLEVPIAVRQMGRRFALIDGVRRIKVWQDLYPDTAIPAVVLTRSSEV